MKFQAKQSNDFEAIPAGCHVAICTGVVELGLQPGRGQYEARPEVWLQFELPTERFSYTKNGARIDGPRVIGRRFRASMGKKANLRKFLESWLGHFASDSVAGEFDLKSLIDRVCMLNIVHSDGADGRTYANVDVAMPLPKSLEGTTYKRESPILYYEIGASGADELSALPEWLRKAVVSRLKEPPKPKQVEMFSSPLASGMTTPDGDFNDEIPF